jgi:predicted HTH transcriptional regulator
VRTRGIEALTAQGIPIDSELWRLDNFQAFLEHRRAELAQIVNKFLDGVVHEEGRRASDIAGLLGDGEGPTLEFKQRVRSDQRTGSSDKALESVVAKAVAGFMNAHGGTLIIGVDDNASPVGLDRDLATLPKPNIDGYELFLRNLLSAAVSVDLCARISIEFPTVDGTQVCALRVPAAPRAVWIKIGNDKVLYVRSGNSTRPLDGEQAHRYITTHWRE